MGLPKLHSEDHVLATTSGLDSNIHTVSGLTARQVLIASSATDAQFRALVEDDLVHTYTSTVNLDAATALQSDTGVLLSDVADGNGAEAWTLNTGALTTTLASVANGRRSLTVQNNGTDLLNVWANGYTHIPNGGLYVNVDPTDANTGISSNYISNNATSTADPYQTVNVVAQRAMSVATSDPMRGVNCECREVSTSGNQSGAVYGGQFASFLSETGAAGLQTAEWSGGKFITGYNSASSYTVNRAHRNANGIAAGRFIWQDSSTGGGTALPSWDPVSCVVTKITGSYGQSIGDFAGVRIEDDFTQLTATLCDAIAVHEPTSSPSATKMNLNFRGGDWDTGHIQLGAAHIWFDGTNIRGKVSAPTSASDGTIIV